MADVLRVLVYPFDGILIGQGLEHNVCVRGKDVEEVRRHLRYVFESYEKDGYDFRAVEPADRDFFTAWDRGGEPPIRIKIGLNDVEFRSASEPIPEPQAA